MNKERPEKDFKEPTGNKSFKQTDQPWKQPVEKEQNPKGVPKPDLEEWQESETH